MEYISVVAVVEAGYVPVLMMRMDFVLVVSCVVACLLLGVNNATEASKGGKSRKR
jgi:hypothetical protein